MRFKFHLSARARKWLILPPLLIGLAVVLLLVSTRPGPQRTPVGEQARALNIFIVEPMELMPRSVGYGEARPARVWRAVARVGGRIVEVHPRLTSGSFLEAEQVALRIDPLEYELAVSRTEAEISQVSAQLDELEATAENSRASLAIEEDRLALANTDLEELRRLRQRDAATDKELREMERAVLAQQQQVQSLRNALHLIPRQRAALEAALAVADAQLELVRLNIERTEIRIPFDCRVVRAEIEVGQFVQPGQLLFEADGIDLAEIDVQLAMEQVRRLLHGAPQEQLLGFSDLRDLFERLPLGATVRLTALDLPVTWPGRVLRLREQIDPRTRTISLVIGVEDPYGQAMPGTRPPLMRGLYCRVELRGPALADQIVIPRASLRESRAYVLDEANRLRYREVEVLFYQGDLACIATGLHSGDRLVIADPSPAIEGMLVDPVIDEDAQARVRREALEGVAG